MLPVTDFAPKKFGICSVRDPDISTSVAMNITILEYATGIVVSVNAAHLAMRDFTLRQER